MTRHGCGHNSIGKEIREIQNDKIGYDAKFINWEDQAGMSQEINSIQPIAADIKKLIEKSRQNVALAVNAEITLLYWHIGKRIKTEILRNERAEYGKKLIAGLSEQLTLEYGKGWSKRHLHHCIRITEIFPDIEIVHALRSQLSWTHLRLIISMEDELKRGFYIEMCKMEKWSSRQLQDRIQSIR